MALQQAYEYVSSWKPTNEDVKGNTASLDQVPKT